MAAKMTPGASAVKPPAPGAKKRSAVPPASAFALIELLVVIAILAALLLPALSNAREKARRAAGISDLSEGRVAACTGR